MVREPSVPVRCSADGCIAPSLYRVCIKLWAREHATDTSEPALMMTGLAVCEAHRESPPSTVAAWFEGMNERAAANAVFKRLGKALPDFDSAVYDFQPIDL